MSFDTKFDRTQVITASEASAVLGCNPYRTGMDVWLAKTGRRVDNVENKYTRLGNALEPVVADLYRQITGFQVYDLAETVRHPELPIAGTPDRFVDSPDGRHVLEIKTAWNHRTICAWGEEGTDAIPEHYRCQGIVYMGLTNLPKCDFALFANGDVRLFTLHRDVAAEAEMFERLALWWRTFVVADLPPPVQSGADLEALKHRWKSSSGKMLTAGPSADNIAREYYAATLEADAATERADKCKALLQECIADADGVESDTWRATWKFAKGAERVDWESVAKALAAPAELVRQHTKTGAPSRRFLFKTK